MASIKLYAGPAETAERLLFQSGHYPLRFLSCRYKAGVLTLSGRLPSFYLKQLAFSLIGGIAEVKRIADRVDVSV